jgi:tetratricopeptide (TPR) repeat protein
MTEKFRVFISSPGDVLPERAIAGQVIERLAREFGYFMEVEPLFWEREPLTADAPFQDNITPPREADAVVVVLWSRLGTLLPADQYHGAVTDQPVTGTEWEFEDALASAQRTGRPDLLLYVKHAPISLPTDNREARKAQEEQLDLVEAFMTRWVRDPAGGSFMAAFHEFRELFEFEEMLETHLRGLIRKRLDPKAETGEPPSRRWFERPYRGLEPFLIDHAQIFHGRTRARNELREALAAQAAGGCGFLLVLGASGSGKSSLVQAGLVSDLRIPGMMPRVGLCRYAVMRPTGLGPDLVQGIAETLLAETALPELGTLKYDAARLAGIIRESPKQLAVAMEQGLAEAGKSAHLTERAEARLALVVDQLEEIFTRDDVTEDQRKRFVAALDALARSGVVWVIATMRSDFLDQLNEAPALVALSQGSGRYLLSPPSEGELGQIVRLPAREAGLRFETDPDSGVSLDEEILAAAAGQPDALPLLEYLLDQLWQKRGEEGCLTFEAYRAIGGLEGALGQRAEQIHEGVLSDAGREAFPRVLRQLVTAGEGAEGVATARTVALDEFPSGTALREVVDAYLAADARLLIAEGEVAGGGARIRVAHEALLTHWPRARDQIAVEWRDLQTRAALERSEARWRAAPRKGRNSLLLPSGLPLAEAEDLLGRHGEELAPELKAYIAASRGRARRRIHLLQAAAAAMFLLALGAGGLGLWAESQRRIAQENFLVAIETADGLVNQLSKEIRNDLRMPAAKIRDSMAHADNAFNRLISGTGASVDNLHRYARLTKVFAETHLLLGDTRNSIAKANAVIKAIDELTARAGLRSEFDLTHAEAWAILGEAYLEQARAAEALSAFEEARKAASMYAHSAENANDWGKVLTRAYIGIGRTVMEEKAQAALTNFRTASSTALLHLNRQLARLKIAQEPKAPCALPRSRRAQKPPPAEELHRAEWLHLMSHASYMVGEAYKSLRRYAQARAAYRESLACAENLTSEFPKSLRWKLDLMRPRWALGSLFFNENKPEEALGHFEKALDLASEQHKGNSGIAAWRRNLSVAHFWVAKAYASLGAEFQARDAYRTSYRILKELTDEYPQNEKWVLDLSNVKSDMGWLHTKWAMQHDPRYCPACRKDKFTRALGHFLDARRIVEKLARAHPANLKYRAQLFGAYRNEGDRQADLDKRGPATAAYRNAESVARKMLAEAGGRRGWRAKIYLVTTAIKEAAVRKADPRKKPDRVDPKEFAAYLALHRDSLGQIDGLLKTEPANRTWLHWRWIDLDRMAGVYARMGRTDAARRIHNGNANTLLKLLAKRRSGRLIRDLAATYESLGDLAKAANGHVTALRYYVWSLRRWRSLTASDRGSYEDWLTQLNARRKKVFDQIAAARDKPGAASVVASAHSALKAYRAPDFEEDYKSSRARWSMPPLVPGPWYNLARRDWPTITAAIRRILKRKGYTVTGFAQIRAMALPFYEDVTLLEVQARNVAGLFTFARSPVAGGNGGPGAAAPGRGIVRIAPDYRIIMLEGKSNPVHHLNETNRILLNSPGQVAAYLRFFVSGLSGRFGPFSVIDDVRDLPWPDGAAGNARHRGIQGCISGKIRPMIVERDATGAWRVVANTKYGHGIYTNLFTVKRNGFVDMNDDTRLISGVPFIQERFINGARRRLPGKTEAGGTKVEGCQAGRAGTKPSFQPKPRSEVPAPRPRRTSPQPSPTTNPFAR